MVAQLTNALLLLEQFRLVVDLIAEGFVIGGKLAAFVRSRLEQNFLRGQFVAVGALLLGALSTQFGGLHEAAQYDLLLLKLLTARLECRFLFAV
ncbi:MAG TPA: hypothetical protein VHZ95_04705 [Polyangiales bacterium]|nr:hypothetical protein [Polyangiales bacterium]